MPNDFDFDAEVGVPYELPAGAPVQTEYEEFQYYRHPAGIYTGFIGKLSAKFKGADNKPATPETPGALFDHYQLPLWIITYLGNADKPAKEEVISLKDNQLLLPEVKPIFECYFGVYISMDEKRRWSLAKIFADWRIPGHAKYNIVQQSAKNLATKVISFSSFPAYYGLPVKFALTFKPETDKQTRYVDGTIQIIDYTKRIPLDSLQLFEKAVDIKVSREQADRAAKSGNKDVYVPETPPDNFDFMRNDNTDDDLESFIKS